MKQLYDVAVAGAGPAGSAAAMKLSEAGVSVVMLEKKNFPRHKTCGGGVVHRARKIMAVDINSVVEREFYSAKINFLVNNESFEAKSDKPLISMTTRASLDYLLALAAKNAGTHIRERAKVLSVSVSNNQVDLQTTSGPVKAKFVIAADGVNSVVAKSAGWKESRLLVPAIQGELYLPDKEMALHANVARFDFNSTHGYAWLFPKKDHLSVGVLSVKRNKVALKSLFSRYIKDVGIRKVQKKEQHCSVIPLRPRRNGFARNRVVLVGDSAGFADPVTAEGIYSAIKSGQLAARALIASDFNANLTVNNYEKTLRQTILPELTAGRIFAKVLYSSSRLRTWVLRRYGEGLTNAVACVILGERSYYKEILNPRNYLKLFTVRSGVKGACRNKK